MYIAKTRTRSRFDGSKELRINDNPFLDGRRDLVIDQYFAKVNGLKYNPLTVSDGAAIRR